MLGWLQSIRALSARPLLPRVWLPGLRARFDKQLSGLENVVKKELFDEKLKKASAGAPPSSAWELHLG